MQYRENYTLNIILAFCFKFSYFTTESLNLTENVAVSDPNLKDSRLFIANSHNCKLSNKLQIYIETKQLRHTFITSENS